MSGPVRELLRQAAARLAAAGVASPESDARLLLAHTLDVPLGRLLLADEPDPEARQRFAVLVERRAARVPAQHLVGSAAFRYVDLAVGPGVFTPRPETELLAGWAVDQLTALAGGPGSGTGGRNDASGPVVVDLCTGSGAIAAALAHEVPSARIHAVELDEHAFAWAQRNLAGTGVDLRYGDFADAFEDLAGTVDVVVSNPPYVPLEAWESVQTEAREHDPHLALFSGDDGLEAIRGLAVRAAELLAPGGVVGVEHADVQGTSAPGVFSATGRWVDVRDHLDLAGRPRFLTARLAR